MSLAKTAQMNLDGFSFSMDSLMSDDSIQGDEILAVDDYMPVEDADDINDLAGPLVMEVGDTPPAFNFSLDAVPGGDDQTDIEPVHIEVMDDDNIEVESDPWKWQIAGFCDWLQNMLGTIPRHSGKDSAGLERAFAYLEALDREISKAVRMDLKNQIAIDAVEAAREEIHKGLDRLHDRLEKVMTNKYPKRKGKKKKKADGQSDDLVKEAKSTRISGITITVPLLISGIARTCINSMVSAGKDLEDTFDKLAKKFDLTPREEFEAFQLLADMGYAIRRPRGTLRNEEVDSTSTDNFDWIANYSA